MDLTQFGMDKFEAGAENSGGDAVQQSREAWWKSSTTPFNTSAWCSETGTQYNLWHEKRNSLSKWKIKVKS